MPRKHNTGRKHDYATILAYIVAYKRANDGNSPGLRQIVDGCGLGSTSVASYILDDLERDGRITRSSDTRRICVVGGEWSCEP